MKARARASTQNPLDGWQTPASNATVLKLKTTPVRNLTLKSILRRITPFDVDSYQ